MEFVSRIKGKRDIHTLTPEEFREKTKRAKAALERGKPDGKYTHQEFLRGKMMVRPFYDYDAKLNEAPDENDLERTKTDHRNRFAHAVGKLHPSSRVLYAQRHGWVEKDGEKKYKISYRAFVCDAVMVLTDIPVHARHVLGKEDLEYLDLSVYKEKQQLLGVIYGCKDIDVIKRYLVPLDENEDPCEYLAQHVGKDAKEVTVTAEMKRTRERKNGGAKSGEKTSGKPSETAGKRTLTREDCSEALGEASAFYGARYRMQEDLQTVIVDKDKKCLIFSTKERWCYIRQRRHEGNNPYIMVTERGSRFQCPDEECLAKGKLPYIPLAENPKSIQLLFTEQAMAGEEDAPTVAEAKEECKRNISDNFKFQKDQLSPWRNTGKEDKRGPRFVTELPGYACHACGECSTVAEHSLRGLRLWCSACDKEWPTTGHIPAGEKEHPKLYAVLNNWNVQQNFVVVNNYGAEADEPVAYEDDGLRLFEDEEVNGCLVRALQGTDASLSEFVFTLFKDSFHCAKSGSRGTDGMWFQFRDHHWVDKAELDLRGLLASEDKFLRYFRGALRFYEREQIQTEAT
jgi:thiol-disulfide isomerase/thioredoxin